MPTAMLEIYQLCDKPPPLHKLNAYRQVLRVTCLQSSHDQLLKTNSTRLERIFYQLQNAILQNLKSLFFKLFVLQNILFIKFLARYQGTVWVGEECSPFDKNKK